MSRIDLRGKYREVLTSSTPVPQLWNPVFNRKFYTVLGWPKALLCQRLCSMDSHMIFVIFLQNVLLKFIPNPSFQPQCMYIFPTKMLDFCVQSEISPQDRIVLHRHVSVVSATIGIAIYLHGLFILTSLPGQKSITVVQWTSSIAPSQKQN